MATSKQQDFRRSALKLMYEKGYSAMTMRDLADEMDCKVSNIYNYIKSKQALLDSVMFEISNKFHDGMKEIEGSTYGSMEKLQAVISMHIRLTLENPFQVQLLVNEWRHLDEDRKTEFVDLRKVYEKKLKTILQQGVKSKAFHTDDIDFSMNCILSSIRWIYSWYSPDAKKGMNQFDIEKKLTQFIMNGVSKEL